MRIMQRLETPPTITEKTVEVSADSSVRQPIPIKNQLKSRNKFPPGMDNYDICRQSELSNLGTVGESGNLHSGQNGSGGNGQQNNGSVNIVGGGGVGGGGITGVGGVGGGNIPGNNGSNKQDENQANPSTGQPIYSIPGILHFLQHEWSRFEFERSQWDVDRAELQSRITSLLGERRGQESLKSDLIRRIKMLEYALQMERAKFHRLKYGCDPPTMKDINVPGPDETGIANEVAPDSEIPFSSVSNITWRQGRQLLRQYLLEIGYTDTIIDVRSNRVRSLLGLNNNAEQEENLSPNVNGNENNKRANESQGRRTPAKKSQQALITEAMIMDSEAAVMANFEFLAQTDVEMSDEDDVDDIPVIMDGETLDVNTAKRRTKGHLTQEETEAEPEEVYNEEYILNKNNTNEFSDWNQTIVCAGSDGIRRSLLPSSGGGGGGGTGGSGNAVGNAEEDVDSVLGLGELAQLTVNNEAETTYDVANSKETYRKTWNAKYTLRSHFDGVRAIAFHPQDPVLITASEDNTLKLWNLQKTVLTKKSAGYDVEPLYTFRAHTGPVLCLAMSANGEQCYSGGLDGTIRCWNLPNSNIDPYDVYDNNVLKCTLDSHKDAVWGLSVNHTKGHLVSCSADSTVKLWSPQQDVALLATYESETTDAVPTSVDFVRNELDRIVVAYASADCIIYDTETGKPFIKLEAAQKLNGNPGKFINKVVCHPTLPITITAHEDRHIRFWDNTTGSMVHSMVAHLEPVTSLAIDAHGLYLLSGSHDCSIRLWNLDSKTCVQEITAHRKKFDESIYDVAFHPTRPFIASAGADALAKIFV